MPDLVYTDLIPEDTTPEAFEDDAFLKLQSQFPGWEPSEGQLLTWLVKAFALGHSQAFQTMNTIAQEIFMYFGANLMNLPARESAAAETTSTWTLLDTAGHTIPAGTVVTIQNGNDQIPFLTVAETLVLSGDDTATITLRAQDPGTASNDINGPVTLVSSLAFVNTVTLDNPTAGGIDAETIYEYLPRLKELLRLMSPRPILPHHFEVLARQDPNVFRAVAIPGLDADLNTTGHPLKLTLAVMDAAGEALTGPQKAAVKASIDAQLMAGSEIFVIDPTYTTIDVTAAVVSLPGFDHAAVIAAVEAALVTYLTPINWGRREGFGQIPTTWVNTTTVRYTELISTVDRVPGVDYVDTLTFKKTGGSLNTTNVSLTGHVPLTEPGTLNIT